MAWMIFLFNQGGSLECFTCLWRIGTGLLTLFINSLYHTVRALLGSMCWLHCQTIRSAFLCVYVQRERERERVCVWCVCVCVYNFVCVYACVCRPNEFQVCSTLAYSHIFISTFLTMPMYNVWESKTDGDNIIYIENLHNGSEWVIIMKYKTRVV